ncbi:HET-domain-containing protein [Dothidotthia symphoricarpi CBS 119687]|uniref:HET-domain-containing protein n=1 Tax=Dothidotthia symphoricarpi CBS 119687 TaxID=1392245 RepID=A0A6A6AL52_9PLEO|nr:HET-domain-containing protein [Dothidotthia symphoricarpi CBS 119687]KAF2131815.1 HET-domain-containing protein [Dothidotthia symphoricarpi CBS 119687]
MREKIDRKKTGVPVTQESAVILRLPTGPRRLCRLYDDSLPLRPQLLRERRVVSQKLDTNLFMHWLHTCYKFHGSDCNQAAWLSPKKPEKLRLIDVHTLSVIHAPFNCTYAALSYVWGGPQFVVNEAQMHKLPFRLPQSPILGRTIEDAISLCRQIGINYLWVDALCIIQDPPVNDDKSFQLQQMDRVYRSACLTICAASSSSANHGIPELHARSSFQKIFSFKGKSYAVEGEDIEHDVDFTPWNWRCWTFQERILSRRLLIITPKQTYWVCQCDTWTESTLSEPTDKNMRHQMISDTKILLPPGRTYSFGQNLTVGAGGQTDMDLAFATYDGLVRGYTPRSLGYPRDGVNAIQGILNLIVESGACRGITFIHGLPVEQLDLALNWKALSGTHGNSSIANSTGLPTWSWGAWFCNNAPGVYYDPADFLDISFVQGAISWYSLTIDGTSKLLPTSVSPTPEKVCGLPSGLDVSCPPMVSASHIDQDGFYLHCLTTLATFSLGAQLQWDETIRPMAQDLPKTIQPFVHSWTTNHTYQILDCCGSCVGQIILSDSDMPYIMNEVSEFAFLAYTRQFDSFTNTLDLDELRSSLNGYHVVSCILIRRDKATGFARRHAIGKVLRKAWELADLKTEWLVLS